MLSKTDKTISAWCWYDWANSSYSLVITSAVFPVYFLNLAHSVSEQTWWQQLDRSVLYAYVYSLASLVILFLSPVFGSISDYSGRKKLFMRLFSFIGAIACMLLYFSTAQELFLTCILFILSSVCYSLGVVFYNAYIPEIAPPDQYDQVSAKGFAWGYLGGMIALIISLLIIRGDTVLGFTEEQIKMNIPVRISFIFIGLWWLLFAAYSLKRLPADRKRAVINRKVIWESYTRIIKAFRRAGEHKTISIFLLAFFFFDMGLMTVMGMAGVFAIKTFSLSPVELISIILLLQLLAIGGSWFFVWIAKRSDSLIALKYAVLLWIVVCMMGLLVQNTFQFYLMAGLVGFVMGGTQSLSRSAFATLIRHEKDEYATFFSVYDVLDKTGVTCGTFLFGWLEFTTGSMRISVAALSIFFIIGFILLQSISKTWKR
jgi:MFS transporter, UMF1 family